MTLAGFTPLMSNPQDPCYAEKTEDMVGHLLCINILHTDVSNNKIFLLYFH